MSNGSALTYETEIRPHSRLDEVEGEIPFLVPSAGIVELKNIFIFDLLRRVTLQQELFSRGPPIKTSYNNPNPNLIKSSIESWVFHPNNFHDCKIIATRIVPQYSVFKILRNDNIKNLFQYERNYSTYCIDF